MSIKKKNNYPSEKKDKVVELVGGGSVINGPYPFFLAPPPPYGREGGLTNEEPGSGHVI